MSTIPSYCGKCLHWMFHHKQGVGCIVDDCTCGREPTQPTEQEQSTIRGT